MKKLKSRWPSVWITEQLEPMGGNEIKKVFDISVKLNALATPVHYNKFSKSEAEQFCTERYGGYTSFRKAY